MGPAAQEPGAQRALRDCSTEAVGAAGGCGPGTGRGQRGQALISQIFCSSRAPGVTRKGFSASLGMRRREGRRHEISS